MFTPSEQSLFADIEMKGVIDTAFGDGEIKERLHQEKLRLEERITMARKLKLSGVDVSIICQVTGFNMNEIDSL